VLSRQHDTVKQAETEGQQRTWLSLAQVMTRSKVDRTKCTTDRILRVILHNGVSATSLHALSSTRPPISTTIQAHWKSRVKRG
jgi:hypothetical protein